MAGERYYEDGELVRLESVQNPSVNGEYVVASAVWFEHPYWKDWVYELEGQNVLWRQKFIKKVHEKATVTFSELLDGCCYPFQGRRNRKGEGQDSGTTGSSDDGC